MQNKIAKAQEIYNLDFGELNLGVQVSAAWRPGTKYECFYRVQVKKVHSINQEVSPERKEQKGNEILSRTHTNLDDLCNMRLLVGRGPSKGQPT